MTGLRRALVAIGIAGLVWAAIVEAVIATSDHATNRSVTLVFGVAIGLSFMFTGLFAWWRRPENRFGALMVAVGFAWGLNGLIHANDAVVFTIAGVLSAVYLACLIQLLLAFPSGRIESRSERTLLTVAWAAVIVIPLAAALFSDDFGVGPHQPRNVILIAHDRTVADAIQSVGNLVAFGIAAVLVVILVRRWRGASPLQRRSLAPVFATGIALTGGLAALALVELSPAPQHAVDAVSILPLAAFGALPYAFLVGLGRSRYSRAGALTQLVAGLSERAALRDSLADALGDPGLRVLYRRRGRFEFVYADGSRAELPAGATLVEDGREVLGALVHDPVLEDEPELLAAATSAAAVAMENERLDAELRARVAELQDARERYLRAGLEERRRLERDLHDGAQQRLVALSLRLGLAQSRIATDPRGAAELLAAAREELNQALGELRELARGIHPAILTDRGLDAALEALADRSPVRVALDATPDRRLPGAVEAAAYFVVAESLTNVARYARAAEAHVAVTRVNGSAVVEVRDDGVGGADAGHGTGLQGLADRLAVLDGRLDVHSPAGGGTLVRATIPCASS